MIIGRYRFEYLGFGEVQQQNGSEKNDENNNDNDYPVRNYEHGSFHSKRTQECTYSLAENTSWWNS